MLKLGLIVVSLIAITAFTTLVNSHAAQAQSNQSHYCQTGTTLLFIDDNDETLRKIYETCKPGDTIGVAAGGDGSVGVQRICDFTKVIQVASRLTVCVMGPLRPVR